MEKAPSESFNFIENLDRRFAVVIGINDYKAKPLNYAVNDARAIKATLLKNCLFDEKDIKLIISNRANPIKDITGKLMEALDEIKPEFEPGESSILFYFAGHGAYHFGESSMVFHDSHFPIKKIFALLQELDPKFLCCVIDACESGGRVLTRGTQPDSKEISSLEDFVDHSEGILLLYACQESEKAHEKESLEHGLCTNHFLDCLKDQSNYDKDGILSPENISSYVKKYTSSESKFKQIPVAEARVTGYYPFALSSKKIKSLNSSIQTERKISEKIPKEEDTQKANLEENKIEEDTSFPVIPIEVRNNVFKNVLGSINTLFEDFCKEFKDGDKGTVTHSNDFSSLPDEVYRLGIKSIIEGARDHKIDAAGGIFKWKSERIKLNYIGQSMISYLIEESKPKYKDSYSIDFQSNKVICATFNFKSKEISVPSFGLGYIIYQAVYGVGIATFDYNFTWNGYNDGEINFPSPDMKAFKFKPGIEEKIISCISDFLRFFRGTLMLLKSHREDEIKDFDKISS